MEILRHDEVWRRISPEETLEVLAKTHAHSFTDTSLFLLIAITIAVGLKHSFLRWVALLLSPLVFQFSAGRRWRRLRPRAILQYLAARSAARRFAFSMNSRDLNILLLFKGTLTTEIGREGSLPSFDEASENVREAAVWVALLSDAVVMLSEGDKGANLEMGRVLDDKMDIAVESADGSSNYSSSRKVHFAYRDTKKRIDVKCTLTSQYPAALIVFEKKLLEAYEEAKIIAEKKRLLLDQNQSSLSVGLAAAGASDFVTL